MATRFERIVDDKTPALDNIQQDLEKLTVREILDIAKTEAIEALTTQNNLFQQDIRDQLTLLERHIQNIGHEVRRQDQTIDLTYRRTNYYKTIGAMAVYLISLFCVFGYMWVHVAALKTMATYIGCLIIGIGVLFLIFVFVDFIKRI